MRKLIILLFLTLGINSYSQDTTNYYKVVEVIERDTIPGLLLFTNKNYTSNVEFVKDGYRVYREISTFRIENENDTVSTHIRSYNESYLDKNKYPIARDRAFYSSYYLQFIDKNSIY
jgi:two-component SAPR family response regulator